MFPVRLLSKGRTMSRKYKSLLTSFYFFLTFIFFSNIEILRWTLTDDDILLSTNIVTMNKTKKVERCTWKRTKR